MKRLIAAVAVALSLGLAAGAAMALPTKAQVQTAIQQGDYAKAETLMREVIGGKPGSADAHYVFAEILAHNGRFDEAQAQAKQAQQIDPALKFTQPEKFREFERLLEREQRAAAAPRAAPPAAGLQRTAPAAQAPAVAPAPAADEQRSGLPGWLWGIGGAAIAVLLWRMLSARRTPGARANGSVGNYAQPAPGYQGGYGNAPGYGNTPGYGQQPGFGPAPGRGGMLGTGIAAAGGFAAGMLADRLMEGHHGQDLSNTSGLANAAGAGSIGSGAFDNGSVDDAARELEQRPVDFGSGGDWEGGDADVASDGGDDGWS